MKNYELDINQFVYENELHAFTIEVLNDRHDFKIVTNVQLATKADYEAIQQAVYEFDYDTTITKLFDKTEKYTY